MRGLQDSVPRIFLLREKKRKGEYEMNDYKEMYYQLFNKITDIINSLMAVQQEMEKMYIETNKESE